MKSLLIRVALSVLLLCAGCTLSVKEEKYGSVYFFLNDYFSNDGISYNSNRKDGNFDTPQNPAGSTYPAEELPDSNTVVPVLAVPGLMIAIPPKEDGFNNNIACRGQVLDTFTPQRFAMICFVGAGTCGDQTGAMKFRYDDGSIVEEDVIFKDWCSTKKDITDTVVFRSLHRHDFKGEDESIECRLFCIKIILDRTKSLTSIQLPGNKNIHIFAITALMLLKR